MADLVSDYDFHLPEELIASRPLERRDASRMLVLDRATGGIAHRSFLDFPSYVEADDLVVLNDSRVIKARLLSPDGRQEVFLLENLGEGKWLCLVRPGRHFRVGDTHAIAGTEAVVVAVTETGERVIRFRDEPDLDRYGAMPIPPYFKRAADENDAVRYQTVFAQEAGSVAAPTAGLHFTPEILSKLPHAFVTLHVGIGTFQPVKVERLEEHRMHEERYTLSETTAARINASRRVFAVGTTVTRVLESQPPGPLAERADGTSIFIRPPYRFQRVDALLTNFHLPRSTLLMLVSALAGRERMLAVYEEAVRERYRFFSYGDCMLIV